MKNNLKLIVSICSIMLLSISLNAQTVPGLPGKPNTWTPAQLIQPVTLVSIIKNPKAPKTVIFNIGVEDDIKGARNVGAASEKTNLEAFKKALIGVPKKSTVVVYCGCCPFDRCPNIRPAFKLVKDLGFTNARLLNLPTNLKTDWISKGYPMASKK